jgi:hypothetical protein
MAPNGPEDRYVADPVTPGRPIPDIADAVTEFLEKAEQLLPVAEETLQGIRQTTSAIYLLVSKISSWIPEKPQESFCD